MAFKKTVAGKGSDLAGTNRKLRLFFVWCGIEDRRITSLTKVADELRTRRINLVFKSYPGEHEWRVWRHSLVDMAPLLFRQGGVARRAVALQARW